MIKPDFWNDEKLGKESESIQLTFIGTWNFSDDYGVVRANPVWLKNQIFPYKENLRLEAFSKWLEALERMEMLIKFTIRGENYYFIRTFRLHQSVEKPSKTRNCSEEELVIALSSKGYEKHSDGSWLKVAEGSGNSRGVFGDEEKISIKGSKENRANALIAGEEEKSIQLKNQYRDLIASCKTKDLADTVGALKAFIADHRPKFIEPYCDYWNLFAENFSLAKVEIPTDKRKNKIKIRVNEPAFDFTKIIEKVKQSPTLRGDRGDWKVTFDWIIENQTNYAKVLDGNYQ